jgi:hypothetical protein
MLHCNVAGASKMLRWTSDELGAFYTHFCVFDVCVVKKNPEINSPRNQKLDEI